MRQDQDDGRRPLTEDDKLDFMGRLQRNDDRIADLESKIDDVTGLVERALRRRLEDRQIRHLLE